MSIEIKQEPNVTYQLEEFREVYEDAMALLLEHYEELTEDKEVLNKLEPDFMVYYKMEELNALRILTARIDGKLIGYFVGLVSPHLHYKNVIFGKDDIYYIHPDYRNSKIGYKLIEKMFDVFKEAGCSMVTIRSKVAHDHSPLLAALGMRPHETTFIKRIV